MKKILFVLIAAAFLSGCKGHSNSFNTVESITSQSELKLEFKTNQIMNGTKKIETALIDKALGYGDNRMVLICGRAKAVYITDLKLNVIKKIELEKKHEELFNKNPFDAFINRDTLFIADNSMSIKKMNLKTGEPTVIPLKGLVYFSSPYYMSVTKEGNYLYVFNCFPNTTKDKVKNADYTMGALFKPDGNMIELIGVEKDLFEHELIGKDRAIYTDAGSKHFVYFEMEKNVLILDSTNKKIAVKPLYVNKDWTKPVLKEGQISAYVVNAQPFAEYKGKLIHWPPPGNIEKRGRVVLYDLNLEPVKKVYLDGLDKIAFYSYFICGDKLVVFSNNRNGDDNFYVYDMKGI